MFIPPQNFKGDEIMLVPLYFKKLSDGQLVDVLTEALAVFKERLEQIKPAGKKRGPYKARRGRPPKRKEPEKCWKENPLAKKTYGDDD
jgi:hypothetical protein